MRNAILFILTILVVGLVHPVIRAADSLSCSSDINADGGVDSNDYTLLFGNFFKVNPNPSRVDINADGTVDISDYSILASNFAKLPNCSSPTSPPTSIPNLITNGSFENNFTDWGSPNANTTITNDAHDGTHGVLITATKTLGGGLTRGVTLAAKKTYKVTVWVKINAPTTCTGDCWGGFQPRIDNLPSTIQGNTGTTYLNPSSRPVGQWFQESFLLSNPTSQPMSGALDISPFSSSDWNWNVTIDDVKFFEFSQNSPPIVTIAANTTSGTTPFTTAFTSNAIDPDGIIAIYRWEFGDGTESRLPNPSHTYLSPGNYTVILTAYDDTNASTQKNIAVTVNNGIGPIVAVSTPPASTTVNQITLTGSATTPNGSLTSLVWDDVNTDSTGIIPINTLPNFSVVIPLKPGTNKIAFTATNSQNQIGIATVLVYRTISAPSVINITPGPNQVNRYDKYETTFDVVTVADNTYLPYDTNPPQGVAPKTGVSVEGIITTPTNQVVSQPAFYFTGTTKTGSGSNTVYQLTTEEHWKLRYTPMQTGTYHVSMNVTDASGTTTVPVGSFTAVEAGKAGFVKVSSADPHYFEFSNGTLYFPIGPTWAGNGSTAFNLDRPWMGGSGAYSANWARWKSSAEQGGNEGFGSHLSFTEHYPGSEVSQYIHYPEGFKMWITCFEDDNFCGQLKSNTPYQIKLRVKTTNIAGPRVAGQPYGLSIKNYYEWGDDGTPNGVDTALRSVPSWIPTISINSDWHTVVSHYTTGSSGIQKDFALYLENVTSGQAYIDEFSVREVTASGLGPELIRNPRADIHTYIEQRPMASFDDMVTTAEQKNNFLRFVIQDKNDWFPNHLSAAGVFVDPGISAGYYASSTTKTAWYQHMWWRYLVARLGYSTSVLEWELNNEGPPDDGTGSHAQKTQEMAQFMHVNDAHPHLASTSFWCCWKPTFWSDKTHFPDVDLGDIHTYGNPDDMVAWYLQDALPIYNDNVGKPVFRGETGINGSYFDLLKSSNPGYWFHDLLWVQLHPAAMFDTGYWFSEHFSQINAGAIAQPFSQFVNSLDLNQGGYIDIAATTGNSALQVIGQKNIAKNEGFAWIRNSAHTWKHMYDNVAITPITSTVTIKMNANLPYKVTSYNTYTGQSNTPQSISSDSSGNITIPINALSDDMAIKVSH